MKAFNMYICSLKICWHSFENYMTLTDDVSYYQVTFIYLYMISTYNVTHKSS